ncbi:hypothetical protein BCS62_21410 [Vibrio cyclitrophicus]
MPSVNLTALLLFNLFFYKSIFGFVPEESFDLPDVNGLITSRTIKSANSKIKIVIEQHQC